MGTAVACLSSYMAALGYLEVTGQSLARTPVTIQKFQTVGNAGGGLPSPQQRPAAAQLARGCFDWAYSLDIL